MKKTGAYTPGYEHHAAMAAFGRKHYAPTHYTHYTHGRKQFELARMRSIDLAQYAPTLFSV